MTGFTAARRKPWVCHLLVLADEILEHAFLGRKFVHGSKVDLAERLDVDWPPILPECQDLVKKGLVGPPYYISLVVILRVVLKDQWLLGVFERGHKLVNATAKLVPPLLRVDEPRSDRSVSICNLLTAQVVGWRTSAWTARR